jgi:ABC-type lipoprotein release transport system permease subunit
MTKILIVLAWRNLWRHRQRTVLTASTLALALTMLVVFVGLGDGGHRQMIESGVRMGSGHIVIQQAGYQEHGGFERVIDESATEHVRNVLGDRPMAVAPRVFASGLASSAASAVGVFIIGIDPAVESDASLYADRLEEGAFLDGTLKNGVVIGRGVARRLELELGRKFVVMAQAHDDAEIQSRLLRVGGIVRTGINDIDDGLLLMPLPLAQEFLKMDGKLHQVAVILPHDDMTSAALADLHASAAIADAETLPWQEALPELRDYIRIDDGGNYLFHAIFFLIVGFMVMNTLLMSVLERRREFALLDALGVAPAQRFVLVMVEALMLSGLALACGLLLAAPIHWYLATSGLPLELFYSGDMDVAGVVVDPVFYSYLAPSRVLQASAAVVTLAMLLAVPPALRAGRRESQNLLGADG